MASSSLLFLLFCSFTLFINVIGKHNCQNKDDDFFAAQIILFFTPKTTSVIREQIAIYYYNPGFKLGDMIAFTFRMVARDQNTTRFYHPKSMKGIILSKLAPTELSFTGESIYKQQCLGYSAHWLRNGTEMTSTCLSTHPDWMFEQKNIIWNRKISSIFIPGTHNSGSYSKTIVQSIIEQFTVTQDHNVLGQLITGARYFDLRPARIEKENLPEYWIAHGSYLMNQIDEVINDIRTFIRNTQEIVIVSFKEFPIGFETEADHIHFIEFLVREFDGQLFPRSKKLWEITLRDIWRSGTRLLISYDNNIYRKSSKIWPRIPQMWGDIRPSSGLEALQSYLTMADANPILPKVAMAQFTLDAMTIASHAIADAFGMEHTSLRLLGAIVGHNITQWYNEIFFRNTSIVAVDFIDATGIVEIAIEWNERRFSTCSDYFFSLMNGNINQ